MLRRLVGRASSRLRIDLEIEFDLYFRPSRSEKYQKQEQHRKNHSGFSFLPRYLQPRSLQRGFAFYVEPKCNSNANCDSARRADIPIVAWNVGAAIYPKSD
jgi:hypothetical protein